MPLLTPEEIRDDHPKCSKCGITFFNAISIQVHRPCRERKLEEYKKSGLFTVRGDVVLLQSQLSKYQRLPWLRLLGSTHTVRREMTLAIRLLLCRTTLLRLSTVSHQTP